MAPAQPLSETRCQRRATFLASADVSCGAARSAVMPERLDPASRMLLLPGSMLSYVALLLCIFCAALLISFNMLPQAEALTSESWNQSTSLT